MTKPREEIALLSALLERTTAKLGAGAGGLERLSEQERVVHAVWGLVLEVGNGGFDQYFHNSAGNDAEAALDGLMTIGEEQGAQALRDVVTYFGPDGPSRDWFTRQRQLAALRGAHADGLQAADRAMHACAGAVVARLTEYARSHLHALLPPKTHAGARVARWSELGAEQLAERAVWVRSGVLDWLWSWEGALPVRAKDEKWVVRGTFRTAGGEEIPGVLTPVASRTGLAGWDVRTAEPYLITEAGALPLWIGTRQDLTPHEREFLAGLFARGPLFPIHAQIDATICSDAHAITIDGVYRLAMSQPQRLPFP